MKKKHPLVSIVIPCYNHDKFVQDSIQSVIDQTYENIELIIIDDGSEDGSVQKIKEMIDICEQRFNRFEFRHRANMGLSATLNEALEWCEGEYFSAIASDDQMLNYKTKKQVRYLETHHEFVAVFGAVQLIDENDKKLEKLASKARSYNFEDIIMHRHNLLAPTQMIRKKAIKDVGGYNANLFIEDWYMWLLLSREGKIFSMNEIFALYRQHDNNISKNFKKMRKGRFEVLEIFKDHDLYEKAMRNLNWVNDFELFSNNKTIKNLLNLSFRHPLRLMNVSFKKLSKVSRIK